MTKVLITGIAGEVGSSLALHFAKHTNYEIFGLDIRKPEPYILSCCKDTYLADVSDSNRIAAIGAQHDFDMIFHFAGILSSGGERKPLLAHEVNVIGTLNLLELAREQSERLQNPVKFVFTSTIAVYGLKSLQKKTAAGAVHEDEHLRPITMYGANKLYCERLGSYYTKSFGMLEDIKERTRIDFRGVRFPGLLSSHTVPTGGTSDYAPEMVHALAQYLPYECFVRPDSRIPFLMMPDAIRALVELSSQPANKLTRSIYNLAGFSPSAEEIRSLLETHFPGVNVSYKPHPTRQRIVDSWPEAVNDDAAKRDWGWAANYSFQSGFDEYLIPGVASRYAAPHVANS